MIDEITKTKQAPSKLLNFLLSDLTCEKEETKCFCSKINKGTHLSRREKTILYYLILGAPSKAIANKLYLSRRTVDNQITTLLLKYRCNTRYELVIKFIKQDPVAVYSL